MSDQGLQIDYEHALAAYEAGQKVHRPGRTYLVRRTVEGSEERPVLWVTDEQTEGDHGLLLFPDGRVDVK